MGEKSPASNLQLVCLVGKLTQKSIEILNHGFVSEVAFLLASPFFGFINSDCLV